MEKKPKKPPSKAKAKTTPKQKKAKTDPKAKAKDKGSAQKNPTKREPTAYGQAKKDFKAERFPII